MEKTKKELDNEKLIAKNEADEKSREAASSKPITDLPDSSRKTKANEDWNVRSVLPGDAIFGFSQMNELKDGESLYSKWLADAIKDGKLQKELLLVIKFGKGFKYADDTKESSKAVAYPDLSEKIIAARLKISNRSAILASTMSGIRQGVVDNIVSTMSNLNICFSDMVKLYDKPKVKKAYRDLVDYTRNIDIEAHVMKTKRSQFADLVYDNCAKFKYVEYNYKNVKTITSNMMMEGIVVDWKVSHDYFKTQVVDSNAPGSEAEAYYAMDLIDKKLADKLKLDLASNDNIDKGQ